jgi:hypothetical protein
MTREVDLADAVIATWKTSNRVTVFLFENLPSELWPMTVPGASRRTVRMIAAHLHNIRCMWINRAVAVVKARQRGAGSPWLTLVGT